MAETHVIKYENLDRELQRQLTLYSESVLKETAKAGRKSMKMLVDTTKETAPVGTRKKHYRENITSKKLVEDYNSVAFLWYVQGGDYRLTHLLEHGHAQRNGGRYAGSHFLAKAIPASETYFMAQIEKAVKNG